VNYSVFFFIKSHKVSLTCFHLKPGELCEWHKNTSASMVEKKMSTYFAWIDVCLFKCTIFPYVYCFLSDIQQFKRQLEDMANIYRTIQDSDQSYPNLSVAGHTRPQPRDENTMLPVHIWTPRPLVEISGVIMSVTRT